MESSNVMAMKCGLIVCVFLSSLSIADSFIDDPTPLDRCYKSCFIECATNKKNIGIFCPFKCMKACMIDPSRTNFQAIQVNYSSCEFVCATSLCSKFSTKEDAAEKEMEKCVDSCSQTCSNKN